MKGGATEINVRYSSGTYTARGGGKSASCTADGDHAVIALARKLGWPRYQVVEEQRLAPCHTRLFIKPEGR